MLRSLKSEAELLLPSTHEVSPWVGHLDQSAAVQSSEAVRSQYYGNNPAIPLISTRDIVRHRTRSTSDSESAQGLF